MKAKGYLIEGVTEHGGIHVYYSGPPDRLHPIGWTTNVGTAHQFKVRYLAEFCLAQFLSLYPGIYFTKILPLVPFGQAK